MRAHLRMFFVLAVLSAGYAGTAGATHCWRCISAACVRVSDQLHPSYVSCVDMGSYCTLGSPCEPTLTAIDAAGILHKAVMAHPVTNRAVGRWFATGASWRTDCGGNVLGRSMRVADASRLRREFAQIRV